MWLLRLFSEEGPLLLRFLESVYPFGDNYHEECGILLVLECASYASYLDRVQVWVLDFVFG